MMNANSGSLARPATVAWRPAPAPVRTVQPMARPRADMPLPGPANPTASPDRRQSLRATLNAECEAMLTYALTWGKKVVPELAEGLERLCSAAGDPTGGIATLIAAHGQLAELVAPAIPNTIMLMQSERRRHPLLHMFGPVRLVRYLLLSSALCLSAVCGLGGMTVINATNMSKSLFELHDWTAFAVNMFLIATAALGASFANLSIVSRFISTGNYDQKYESSYWIRMMLGMMSGVILGALLFDLIYNAEARNTPSSNELQAMTRIGLAFLGGYSAAQVQSLLDTLSATLGRIVPGSSPSPPTKKTSPPSADGAQ